MKLFRIYWLVLFSVLPLFAQNNEKAAQVGKVSITKEYFENRFKLAPQLSRSPGITPEKERYNFLYTLIAEKLWSNYAEELGLDETEEMRRNFLPIERMYIRDALFQNEVSSKVKINPVEVLQTYQKLRYSLITKFIFSSDSTEAISFYLRLKSGENIDTLLKGRTEQEYQSDGLEIAYTKSNDQILEQKLYTLKTPGDVLLPYKDKEGWFVFQLISLKDNISADNTSESLQKTSKELLQAQKTDSVYQAFYKKFFGGISVETNGDMFWSLHSKFIYIMTRDSSKRKDNRFSVGMEYIDELRESFGPDSLAMPFLSYAQSNVPLSELLIWFLFERFSVSTLDPPTIAAFMQNRVKFLIEQDLLYKEGLRRGLDKDPQVHEDITMWRDYYLSMKAKELFSDSISISENESVEYYKNFEGKAQTSVSVNLAVITTDSLDVIQSVLDFLKTRRDFSDLTEYYRINPSASTTAKITGLVAVESLGDIGHIAKVLEKNEVYGPLLINGQYIIFKVLDKLTDTLSVVSYNEAKQNINYAALKEKKNTLLDKKTAALADKYGVKIFQKVMNQSTAANLQMVLFRFMGFGGRIVAFPVTQPYSRWTNEWKQKPESLP